MRRKRRLKQQKAKNALPDLKIAGEIEAEARTGKIAIPAEKADESKAEERADEAMNSKGQVWYQQFGEYTQTIDTIISMVWIFSIVLSIYISVLIVECGKQDKIGIGSIDTYY